MISSLLVLPGLIAALLILRKYGLSWQRNVSGNSSNLAVGFYREMLRRLERAGYRREPSQTPAEFASQVSIPGVEQLTLFYQRARFGDEKLSNEEVIQIESILRDLKRLSRRPWRFGRRHISTISPNKTLEGLVAGMAGSLVIAFALVGIITPWDRWSALALGAVVAVLAPLGDLCESMLKRDLGVKDFGGLLPGHGGVLDRFDAILFSLPAVYYLVRLLEVA